MAPLPSDKTPARISCNSIVLPRLNGETIFYDFDDLRQDDFFGVIDKGLDLLEYDHSIASREFSEFIYSLYDKVRPEIEQLRSQDTQTIDSLVKPYFNRTIVSPEESEVHFGIYEFLCNSIASSSKPNIIISPTHATSYHVYRTMQEQGARLGVLIFDNHVDMYASQTFTRNINKATVVQAAIVANIVHYAGFIGAPAAAFRKNRECRLRNAFPERFEVVREHEIQQYETEYYIERIMRNMIRQGVDTLLIEVDLDCLTKDHTGFEYGNFSPFAKLYKVYKMQLRDSRSLIWDKLSCIKNTGDSVRSVSQGFTPQRLCELVRYAKDEADSGDILIGTENIRGSIVELQPDIDVGYKTARATLDIAKAMQY